MAGASLLTLLDDIASILDDVSAMTKVATKKTAGVLGDDLALNAQQVSGVRADRELAVVWAVAKGSFKNKAILVPAALVISAVAPVLIMPLLMLGGAFLCYEGFEKIVHTKAPSSAATDINAAPTSAATETDKESDKEADKIRGAIRTDFILSAEIIVISLGTVADAPLLTQCSVLVAIALLMTVGVYGLVAGIVKLDDAGLYLSQRTGALRTLGNALLRLAPWLMKTLSVVGTAAMFLVGGGILAHGVPPVHHLIESAAQAVTAWPLGGVFSALTPTLLNALIGMAAGAVVFAVVALAQRLRRQRT